MKKNKINKLLSSGWNIGSSEDFLHQQNDLTNLYYLKRSLMDISEQVISLTKTIDRLIDQDKNQSKQNEVYYPA
jgi:hypothetical protein